MPKSFGPHLLGRRPSPIDVRDYRLENFLGHRGTASASPAAELETALDELKRTKVGYARWASTDYVDVQSTHWWVALDALARLAGDLPPAPTPPPGGLVHWEDSEPVLDQGDYGTCVGNGWAQWGNTLPIDDRFTEKDARAIYLESTTIGGEPDDPDAPGGGQQGSTVRWGAQAMQARGRLSAYAFAGTLDAAIEWLELHGPVVIGSDWTDDMFEPDARGFVIPSGSVAGGHCYLLAGYNDGTKALEFLNSWGAGWGDGGRFRMTTSSFEELFASNGEACAAVELG